MNTVECFDLEHFVPQTDREDLLFRAWKEEEILSIKREGKLEDVSCWLGKHVDGERVFPDLKRILETLNKVREICQQRIDLWMEDHEDVPDIKSDSTIEKVSAVCMHITDLFDEVFMDLPDLEALELACEIIEELPDVLKEVWV